MPTVALSSLRPCLAQDWDLDLGDEGHEEAQDAEDGHSDRDPGTPTQGRDRAPGPHSAAEEGGWGRDPGVGRMRGTRARGRLQPMSQSEAAPPGLASSPDPAHSPCPGRVPGSWTNSLRPATGAGQTTSTRRARPPPALIGRCSGSPRPDWTVLEPASEPLLDNAARSHPPDDPDWIVPEACPAG